MKSMKLFDKDGKEYKFESLMENDRTQHGFLEPITPEPEKWQCPKIGGWCLNAENRPVTNFTFPSVGNVYPTAEKTQEAANRRTEFEIINQCIMYWQEELEPEWVANWGDDTQTKYNIVGYNRSTKNWWGRGYHTTETHSLPCSSIVKEKVLELLNNGLVEGVNR